MKFTLLLATLAAASPLITRQASNISSHAISAPDGSIHASFVEVGAALQRLLVKDRYGAWKDVVLGFDDLDNYFTYRSYFNTIVGRYANRLQNGTFSIPPVRNVTDDTPGVKVTLHSGFEGFDTEVWTFLPSEATSSSVSFGLTNPDGFQGWPGTIVAKVKYELKKKGELTISIDATAKAKTPIMLTSHTYFNLDAYNETGLPFLDAHNLQLAADRVIDVDSIQIPTGNLIDVDDVPALDFRKGHPLNTYIKTGEAEGICGPGCNGYDNDWIYSKNAKDPKTSLWSTNSGIRLDISTNQVAGQVYTCNGIANDAFPRKAAHGGPGLIYENQECVALEQQSWIAGVNNPQWGIDQIYGPGTKNGPKYGWSTSLKFSTFQ
ncbi:galactose mutarotase-like protein [Atractiella rhizophila]|nr:galactose mutarotase-like protein [Atractiella rhizophila]